MINLLLFDLDGTLFDTAPGIANAFNNLMKEFGENPVDEKIITSFIGSGLKELLLNLDNKLAHRLGELSELEKGFHRYYSQNIVAESPLFPGVVEFLQEWPHKIAVVSNKSEHYVRELVYKSELRQFHWERLIGGNSLPTKKPHPEPLREVMTHAQVKPENCLMIGDGLADMVAAQQAGIKSVAVSFGYSHINELIRSGAHATIAHYKELSKVIRDLS
ncbi:MAG: hypothetical protein A2Z20_02370 [Bdellovibrionales bacterium RBG_16_40_8]|nr:MAG: hypothetical protein A2Z20_02370 [Bdellovibrionales bacterium RBG_16_40_8]